MAGGVGCSARVEWEDAKWDTFVWWGSGPAHLISTTAHDFRDNYSERGVKSII